LNTDLFAATITDEHSWKSCWQSKETYIPLLKHIYQINKLSFGEVSTFSECSNAVFRIGETILKIFYPQETAIKDGGEYMAELEGLKFCNGLGINTPDIICNGIIHDSVYTFPYIVMNYINGIDADTAFMKYSQSEKVEHVKKLKELVDIISVPTNINIPRYDEPCRINHNFWNRMPTLFQEDRMRYIENATFPDAVFNQGDFGGQNIIIDTQGRLHMIDFASCLKAPWYYEMPIWEDSVLMDAYYGDYKNDDFYDTLLMATLVYHWSPFNIENDANDLGVDVNSITSVAALRDLLVTRVNSI